VATDNDPEGSAMPRSVTSRRYPQRLYAKANFTHTNKHPLNTH
jgi:hypothetical protein